MTKEELKKFKEDNLLCVMSFKHTLTDSITYLVRDCEDKFVLNVKICSIACKSFFVFDNMIYCYNEHEEEVGLMPLNALENIKIIGGKNNGNNQ